MTRVGSQRHRKKSEYNETNADDGKKFVFDTSILQLKAEGGVVHYES
jgi:hypothetical protein